MGGEGVNVTAHTLGAFLTALALSAIGTAVFKRVAPRLGLVDQPDHDRKLHAAPMPTGGGVVIFLSAAVVIVIGLSAGIPEFAETLDEPLRVLGLGVAATGMLVLGLFDDMRRLDAWTKLWVQIGLAVFVYAAGVRIDTLGLGGVGLSLAVWISLPVTVAWLVGITNSFNLIDGSDGVAGGAALFALFTFAIVSLMTGQDYAAALALILAGATLGFLFYNFPPASIYLGDAGSQLLGFSLAALAVVATQKSSTVVAIAVPILSFGVPILDTALAVVRRVIRGRPVFEADRGHIHHRLAELGHSPRMIAFGLWGVSAIFGLLSLLLLGGTSTEVAIILLAAGAMVFVLIQRLHLPELFAISGWVTSRGSSRDGGLHIDRIAHGVRSAPSVPELLDMLADGFSGGQFVEVELRLSGSVARPLRTAPEVRVEGDLTLWRRSLETGGHSWESRFPIESDEVGPSGLLILRHAARYTGSRLDLGPVPADLVPAIVWSLEEFVSRMPRLTEPPPGRRESTAGDGTLP